MRGEHRWQETMFSYVAPEARVPQNHPLRPIRATVDRALTAPTSSPSCVAGMPSRTWPRTPRTGARRLMGAPHDAARDFPPLFIS